MTRPDPAKHAAAQTLDEPAREANALARKLGLDPYDVQYWVVDHDEMNELIAYDGFQTRYPHWRWGMKYEKQRKQTQFLGGKAFEIVNNDDPSNAFLQVSNDLADQKAVITHVEGHADFFNNNQWFGLFADGEGPDAAAMLERHADRVASFLSDPEIGRESVERFIDTVLTIEDNIEYRRAFDRDAEGGDPDALAETLASLGVSEEVRDEVFTETWLDDIAAVDDSVQFPETPEYDLLAFLRDHGQAYDEDAEKAAAFEDWQRELLELLRREAYYFAPQRTTKVMNEGWAAYWESMMMGEEAFAGDDEFLSYADHQARVLNSPGFNPYKLGKELWEYVENRANRRAVLEHLLRVDGVTWRNFHDTVDTADVVDTLAPPAAVAAVAPDELDAVESLPDAYVDWQGLAAAREREIDVQRYPWKLFTYEGLAHRHYSLAKPQYRGFLGRVTRDELESVSRYLFDTARYASVEAALADVSVTAGWDRMYSVRESHNDVTFVDEFLTQEFVDANEYFAYEFSQTRGDFRATSTDAADVKRKLLLRFTNLGKPTIAVYDANHENRGELLLGHEYNGVMLDREQAEATLQRVFELWGRPVVLHTITKRVTDSERKRARRNDREPEPEEVGVALRYDGESVSHAELDWETVEHLAADDLDYDTKPDEWL
ncbi:SpoVR family protein [Halobacterium salinarum]|uniref:SpoVR family protein n=1 Tax=Halobacterium salinarum (strain ATCC 33171 / DSM 3754 / JCM 8978 / NBRC 102687 / NCIMB 764 / 91-R6) TaxID=2597657 RepID=A0A4D6GRY7_HALS9|nr:SpoVR family protein [Halobacterium salinarum]MDL0124299.1 SpoVR family protein [Halobacterium salinarum]MDL0130656.1 SpoVR family protein [Halobacterium salinarum]MDL0135953.1 SpoVR family protein [Halobacterium salinarum]MDL0144306.1 SpoVR family protein [Halobacterium salinarum]QCC44504.1 SpoVR family protein [Halobacterium salinarum]